MAIQEIVKQKKIIFVRVEKGQQKAILQYAKENGFVWVDGEEIFPNEEKQQKLCGYHLAFSLPNHIGYISTLCWKAENASKKFDFVDGELKPIE